MDCRWISNSKIADFELLNVCIDYANGCITIELRSPGNVEDTLVFTNFIEIMVTRKEPWGPGKYIGASELIYQEQEIIAEIQLNSGDLIKITMKETEGQ